MRRIAVYCLFKDDHGGLQTSDLKLRSPAETMVL